MRPSHLIIIIHKTNQTDTSSLWATDDGVAVDIYKNIAQDTQPSIMRVLQQIRKKEAVIFQAVNNQCTSQCLVIKCEKERPLDKEKIQ